MWALGISDGNGTVGDTGRVGSVAHHAGKLGVTAVGSWLTVATKSGNLGKVELELVL